MAEPKKKPNTKKPESYKPEAPKMMNMLEEAQEKSSESKIPFEKSDTDIPTDKSLEFNIPPSNYLENLGFIQSFACAYLFIETKDNPEILNEFNKNSWNGCVGCGSGGDKHHCTKDNAAAKRCTYFALFNTMCGNSSMRRRFDGTPTEMQILTGDTDNMGHSGGTDFVVDFLFGYTGYEYRKCIDSATLKIEIQALINSGKPVIAKFKSGNHDYRVIIGYDGDFLKIPYTVEYDYNTNPPTIKEKSYTFDDIDFLYIFGDKLTPRYTLIDGLKNIRRVREYNINEGIWDEYLKKLGGCENFPSDDGLDKADSDERKNRAQIVAVTNLYMFNSISFSKAFFAEKLPEHYLNIELSDPELSELWGNMDPSVDAISDAGHKTWLLNQNKIWEIDDLVKIEALSAEICEVITKAKEADIKILDIINQAIKILERNEEENV